MANLTEVNWAPIVAAVGTYREVLRLLSEKVTPVVAAPSER